MKRSLLTLLALTATLLPAHAQVRLAPVFGSHMVLQRGQPMAVWGTAGPGESVTVELSFPTATSKAISKATSKMIPKAPLTATAQADATGRWMARLGAVEAGEGLTLTVRGSATKNPVVLEDVAMGEVWVCSGQSNMQFTLKDAAQAAQPTGAAEELPLASHPRLRFFNGKSWAVCTPESAAGFSAVGYFFGKTLTGKLGVPVGMIGASVGGTPIQAWTPEATLRALPALRDYVALCDANARLQKDDPAAFARKKTDLEAAHKAWRLDGVARDVGTREAWFAPTASPAASPEKWGRATLPMQRFTDGFNDLGTVWYRRTVEIPAAWVGKALVWSLPGIDDVDIAYAGGREIGRTWYDSCERFWQVPRRYSIPAELVTSTRLDLTLLVLNVYGIGGVFGKPGEMTLSLADKVNNVDADTNADKATPPVSLAGEWRVRRGSPIDLKSKPADGLPTRPGGYLYDEIIAPLQPCGLRGVLWYQGESNADEPDLYAAMFPAMIRSWREAWGRGDFAFYFVSLAGYMGHQEMAVERQSWAEIREAQTSGLALPRTGAAMAYDIGDANDIHPANKREVGRRLALLALARDYGVKTESQGPAFQRMEIKGDTVRLRFTHAKGLAARGAELRGFAVAGSDKVFHFAKADIKDGAVVLVAADGAVPRPVAVRYGWSSIPGGNLYNSAGLPAPPFRTDAWPRGEIGTTGPGCP